MSVSSPEQEKEKHRAPTTNQPSNRLFPGKQSLSSIIIGNLPQSGNRRHSLGKKATRMSTMNSGTPVRFPAGDFTRYQRPAKTNQPFPPDFGTV
jgi:hypothetical protein